MDKDDHDSISDLLDRIDTLTVNLKQRDWIINRIEEILQMEYGKIAAYSVTQAWGELPPWSYFEARDKD